MHSEQEIVVQQDGAVVQVTLNRPGYLNALSLEMIRILSAGLTSWAQDDSVSAVLISGAGDRAFCAGGDVKSTYRTGMAYRRNHSDERVLTLFYAEEYRLNRQLYHFKKPLVALMNGITMGGGYGIAGPCRFRVATEATRFAMPEVGIGFFPDVGSVYFLNRAPGEAGTVIVLTGDTFGAADMIYAGLASHYVPAAQFGNLGVKLAQAVNGRPDNAESVIAEILSGESAVPDGVAVLDDNLAMIDSCFSGDDVAAMLTVLERDGNDWARAQAQTIRSRSPISLAVSLAHLRSMAGKSFDDVTAQDYVLAHRFMTGHDFYEGVRAQLIDKDRTPRWDPDDLGDVTPDMIRRYFQHAGPGLDEIAA